MAILLAVVAAIILVLSLYGVLLPDRLARWVQGFMAGRYGLTFAIAVRVLLAILLWLTAAESQTPTVFKVLAVITLLAAVVLPLVGIERIRRLIDYVAGWPGWAVRLGCLLGVVLGVFLLWSIWPAI